MPVPPEFAPHASVRVSVVGDEALGAALADAGLDVGAGAPVVVVVGDVAGRAEAARTAVAGGGHVFVAWPPGALAEAEALLRDAEEAGVEVGVERPLAWPAAAPSRVVAVTLATDGTAWTRRIAGALDVCAELAGRREAVRVTAEADRDGARLRAVAATVRFQNGVLAQALVRSGEASGAAARVTSGGAETSGPVEDALAAEALTFVRAVAAGGRAAYPLHDAIATLRLAERVAAALR